MKMCQQAQVYCTPGRAKKVTAAMLLVGFTASTIVHTVAWLLHPLTILYVVFSIYFVLFYVIVPVSVLVINMIVVREVRRAANNAAVNLGLQQHQQSTSSNSVVPTVMVVTTSLIYVLLSVTWSSLFLMFWWMPHAAFSPVNWVILSKVFVVAYAAYSFVFSYNFYVYLITGKRFRCELHKLICRCRSAAAEAAADAARVPTRRADLADTAV